MDSAYSFIADLAKEVIIPKDGILSRTLYNDDRIKVVIFGFAAGQELSAHTAPMSAMLYLVEGEARLTLGNDSMDARAGAFVRMPPQLVHGIVAKTPVVLLLLMLK